MSLLRQVSEPPQPEHMPDVARESQTIQDRQEIEQGLVVRVREPAVDGDTVGCGEQGKMTEEGAVSEGQRGRDERAEKGRVRGKREDETDLDETSTRWVSCR